VVKVHRLTSVIIILILAPAVAYGSVDLTGIRVEDPAFSPNGDGRLDQTTLRFAIESDLDWVQLWVWVTDEGGATVRTLAEDEAAEPGEMAKVWDGRDGTGEPAPEGSYTFRLYARAGQDTTPTFSAGTLLDLSSPLFSTLISPNPYTPDLPMADSLLSVKVDVEASEPEDRLAVYLTKDAEPETLCTTRLDMGNTTYECNWDGRESDDGTYPLRVSAYDDAGNVSEASYAVALDTQGPSLVITEPQEGYFNSFPEEVRGLATDLTGIDSLGFRFQADSAYGPVTKEVSGDTLYWQVSWPGDLQTDGTYNLGVYSSDIPGHTATTAREVVIDTQAPDAPEIDPLPAEVYHPRVTVTGTCPGRDSLFLSLNDEIARRLACAAAGTFSTDVTLLEGANTLQATARDKAGNQSPPSEVVTVTYIRSVGIVVPERFGPDSVIDVTLAKEADLIRLMIYTLEGSHVSTITKPSPALVDEIKWDLRDSDGKKVRNGLYLLVFELVYSDGESSTEKKAVVVAR
jgi:flagellar hook assembly protein FlgD